jgi:hypothetical protein
MNYGLGWIFMPLLKVDFSAFAAKNSSKSIEEFRGFSNTQTNLYQQKIANLGYSTLLLPLFDNISNINLIDAVAVKRKLQKNSILHCDLVESFWATVQVFIKALKLELKKVKLTL